MDNESDKRGIKDSIGEQIHSDGDSGANFSQTLYIDTNSYGMSSRASSTCSLTSWTFSPIPALSPTEPAPTQQEQCRSIKTEPSNTPQAPGSEYYNYNTMCYQDYHSQSVYQNTASYDWQNVYQWYYPVNHAVLADRSLKHANVQHIALQNDYAPMNASNLHTTASEINRCSTPELISALASIPPDNESKAYRSISPLLSEANHVLANESTNLDDKDEYGTTNAGSVSVVSENCTPTMYMRMAHRYQDSGYQSDMCMSPVYPYAPKSHTLSSADVSSQEEEDKENDGGDATSFEFRESKPQPPKFCTIMDYVTAQNKADEVLTTLCNSQIQSNDISSSIRSPLALNARPNCGVPFPLKTLCQRPESKAVICHRMPPVVPHRPNIKRCESAAKRKITDVEIQDQMNREKRRQRHNQPLNLKAVNIMTCWYEDHLDNPYPSKAEKEMMAKEGGLTLTQVKSWFANKRNRSNNTKPKVQKRQMSERLLNICHQLARSAKAPSMNNADIIQQLSTIITTPPSDNFE